MKRPWFGLIALAVIVSGASVVVQVAVERSWTTGVGPVADSVPHIVLLTMAYEGGTWSVDDAAAVSW
jgi:hypothetical protein